MNFKYYKSHSLVVFILVLFFLCNFLAGQIDKLLANSPGLLKIIHLIHTFSTLSLILFGLFLVNKFGWKCWAFKWLINLPDLNGRYEGELVSSYKNEKGENEKKKCALEIKQTGSEIHVFAYFGDYGNGEETSASHSVSEELIHEKNGLFSLYYIFTSETAPLQVQLNNHAGTSKFKYYPDNKTLEGEYYNQRNNFGKIKVVFESENRIGRLEK